MRNTRFKAASHARSQLFHNNFFCTLLIFSDASEQHTCQYREYNGCYRQFKIVEPCLSVFYHYYLLMDALLKSQIGRKMPSASTRTMAPRKLISTGSICAESVFSS